MSYYNIYSMDTTWDYFRRVVYRLVMGKEETAYELWKLTKQKQPEAILYGMGDPPQPRIRSESTIILKPLQ